MLINSLKAAQFELFIDSHEIVLIDFWAEWCAPCKQFAMVYEQVAEQYPAIQFAKVNVEEECELAELFQIRSIPHLLVFKQGIVVYSESGSMPGSVLEELIEQAKSVDVSKIREQLDKGEVEET